MENLVTTYILPKDCFSEVFCIIIPYLHPFQVLKWRRVYGIFKSLQNLSPLPTSLRVEPLAKPKTSLKFIVNTTKPKTKVLAVFGQNFEIKVIGGETPSPSLTCFEYCY